MFFFSQGFHQYLFFGDIVGYRIFNCNDRLLVKNEDDLKSKDNLKNEDDLTNEDDLKNEDDIKIEDNLKNKEDIKKRS